MRNKDLSCCLMRIPCVNHTLFNILFTVFVTAPQYPVKAVGYLKLPFFPSYASFTFPFVISAIAAKQTMACLMNMERPMPVLKYVVLIETVIAVVFVVYTLVRFLQFIFVKK